MNKKFLLISEALNPPFDEGIKNVAFSVHRCLTQKFQTISITRAESKRNDSGIKPVSLNKLFLNYELKKIVTHYNPDFILYLPEASITFNSFVRAKVLKCMSRFSRVALLGVKEVDYTPMQRKLIIKYFRPDSLLLLGKFGRNFFMENGVSVKVLPPAVDNVRFSPAAPGEREKLRYEFGIPDNKTVVLHVGHIRPTRNVQCFSKVQKIENIQVVVVGSTSTPTENNLKEKLLGDGVLVMDKYIPDITKVYRMADVYIFPVINKIACIDMPLSVLEAMACNLPIITTRFGGLEDTFKEDSGFRYFDTVHELIELVKSFNTRNKCSVHNIQKVEPYTWSRFTDQIIAACSELP